MNLPEASTPDPIDPSVLAGEYALGVLEGDALALARRRLLADRDFADAVAWWQGHLAGIAETSDFAPVSPALWPAIAARIDAVSHEDADRRDDAAVVALPPRAANDNRWNVAALVSSGLLAAVALALFVSGPRGVGTPGPLPTPAPVAGEAALPHPELIAQLNGERGPMMTTRIDPRRKRMAMAVAPGAIELADARGAELWVMTTGSKPISLGMLPPGGNVDHALSDDQAAMLVEGAMLAVTYEPMDGMPHAAPSTPVIASAALVRV